MSMNLLWENNKRYKKFMYEMESAWAIISIACNIVEGNILNQLKDKIVCSWQHMLQKSILSWEIYMN